MVENPEFELSGYLVEAIDDVGGKSDPTSQEEMTRKTITGEQIDTGLMHIPFVKEPAGEPNKFSHQEISPGYKSELKLVLWISWCSCLHRNVVLPIVSCSAQLILPCVGAVS